MVRVDVEGVQPNAWRAFDMLGVGVEEEEVEEKVCTLLQAVCEPKNLYDAWLSQGAGG